MANGGPDDAGVCDGRESGDDAGGGDLGAEGGGCGGEGPLMKAVRVLASRLVDLGSAPSAPVG